MEQKAEEKKIDHQEKKVDLKEEIKQAEKYKYDQSSKGSELIRKIVFAIIGSCWILMFAKGKYQDTNVFLKVTIACSFVYLLLDVIHYLWDTCSYHAHAQIMEQCTTSDYYEHVYKPDDLKISQRSFGFFIAKVALCFAVSGAFLLGMFIEPLYGIRGVKPSTQTRQEENYTPVRGEWKYASAVDGYEWVLYSGAPESSDQIMTIYFDQDSKVRSVDF